MASGLPGVVVLVLCVVFSHGASADMSCNYYENGGTSYPAKSCDKREFCCGSCSYRYCCSEKSYRFTEDEQEECNTYEKYVRDEPVAMFFGIGVLIIVLLIFICCCVCPCCCLYKVCCKPRPVVATTTHTTVVTTSPRQYPQQPTAVPQPSYPGYQYPSYQSVPQQPGYGIQPMPQAYHQAPPSYQEAIGPGHSTSPMPYSQAAYSPGQPAYPLQPPYQPQPNAPPVQPDFLAQPAYNPDYVPPKTG